jgi:pimeloyl-ACP methyl ester carboxylesterase
VSDLQQGIEQIGEPPLLVAHSMGGMVVQRYLKAHRARGAVLLAAVPPHGLLPTSLHLFGRHPLAFLQAVLACSPYKVVGTPSLCQEFLFSPDLPEEQLAAYFARIQDESFRAYLDMLLPDLARPGRVETPILVLGAANDRAISPREVEATARALGVKPEFFPGMAHDVMLETDWQAVADRILGWFSEQGVTT